MNAVIYCDPFVPPEWIAAHGITPQHIVPQAVGGNSPIHITFGVCPYARAFINETILQTETSAAIFTTCLRPDAAGDGYCNAKQHAADIPDECANGMATAFRRETLYG